jgi:hypothetical protein
MVQIRGISGQLVHNILAENKFKYRSSDEEIVRKRVGREQDLVPS